jgi:hypothetical protein
MTRWNRLTEAAKQPQAENLERRRAESAQIRFDALVAVMTDVAALAERWAAEARTALVWMEDTGDAPEGAEIPAGRDANTAAS